jgi:hypothetical protein
MSFLAIWEQRTAFALARTFNWLCELPLTCSDPVSQLLRLFALSAIDAERTPDNDAALRQFGAAIPQFEVDAVSIDPVLALSTHRALRVRGVEHPSLNALVDAYGSVLSCDSAGVGEELALVAYLCRLCGLDVPEPRPSPERVPHSLIALMTGDRSEMLEVCRLVLMISACGVRQIEWGDVSLILPGLALSYAMEWDVEAVTTLLRTCVYASVANEPSCGWALEWLLDQQEADGRFGLLAPESVKMRQEPADWKAYLAPTVSAVWCLSEMKRPGFLVSPG